MKKFVLILIISSFVLILAMPLIVKNFVGDIRPSLPVKQNLAERFANKSVGKKPDIGLSLPDGFAIGLFAEGLNNVRDLEFSDGQTLLASLPQEGKVVALPDKNSDGITDETKTVLDGLDRPHGIAFFNGKLFVAEETRVSRFSWDEENLEAVFEKKLFDLPSGGRHFTRSLVFDSKGNMYVSIGSTCDVCEEKQPFIGTVIISDANGKTPQIFSRGLRNAVFIARNPITDEVWVTEMGRDFLGDNTPNDEINILKDGADFGWPYCYNDKIYDSEFGRKNMAYCNNTKVPFYQIPAHSAPLGLAFINSQQFPKEWQGDLFVSYHGSWNRSTPTGYKIVRISTKGKPQEQDFLSGFLSGSEALGRPVDVVFDSAGSLYISDDKSGAVYKIVKNN